jgi:hypothetical protein
MMKEALRIRLELGDRQHTLLALSELAGLHSSTSNPHLAARLLASSLALSEEAGLVIPVYQRKWDEETLARLQESLDHAAFAEAWGQGARLSLDEAAALALGESDGDA